MITKFPIEVSDQEGITDAVNYLLSGPAGLGQNFDGFSDYSPLIIRPTFARPFTLPINTTLDASWYIRMPVTAVTPVGGNPSDQITVDFTPPAPYTDPPFQFGDRLRLTGFADSGLPYGLNEALDTPTGTKLSTQTGTYGPVATTTVTGVGSGAKVTVELFGTSAGPYSSMNTATTVDVFNVGTGYVVGDTIKVLGTAIGGATPANDLTLTVAAVDSGFYNDSYYVFSSTTTSVDLYSSLPYNWPAITTLGSVVRDFINTAVSTDCLAQVVVDSYTQRIFITAQVEFSYTVFSESSPPLPAWYTNTNFDIVVQVNRYSIGRNANGNQVYAFQKTISQKILNDDIGGLDVGSAIFTTVVDQQLNFGSYAYILEIAFVTAPRLSNGTTPGTSGYGTSIGWLFDQGFQTAPLPTGVAAGNVQYQGTAGGTTYSGVVPTVLTGSGANPSLDVTVWPNALIPNYSVGDHNNGYSTVEIVLSTTAAGNNVSFVPGDVIKIVGTDIGGATPLNDLYLTVTETDLRSNSVPGKFTMGLRNLTTQVIKE